MHHDDPTPTSIPLPHDETAEKRLHLTDQIGVPRRPRPRFGGVAFWVRGDTVMEVDDRHVRAIIAAPEWFGITEERVQELHKRYGEKRGVEGRARAELIADATKNGWMRVRHYVDRNQDYWSLQVDHRGGRRELIHRFVRWAMSVGYMHADDSLRITDEERMLPTTAGLLFTT